VQAPVLLGAITALFALVPMGPVLVWLPVGFGLIATGSTWQGVGLLLWGVFVISTIDNVIRPLVISGAGRVPLLVAVFGFFGGLMAFGFIGLFIGPIILSVLLAVWRAWLAQQDADLSKNKPE
jgi:P-type Ca2+ transporter type 2C